MQPVGWDYQREFVWNADGGRDIESGPVFERLRTVQSIAPPANSMVPAFNKRCRGLPRFFSCMTCLALVRSPRPFALFRPAIGPVSR